MNLLTYSKKAFSKLGEAVDSQEPFHVTIIGKMMPDGDAYDLGETIKADGRFQTMVLVMLSTDGQQGDIPKTGETVFAGHLIKPIKRSQLFRCLTTALKNASQPSKDESQAAYLFTGRGETTHTHPVG